MRKCFSSGSVSSVLVKARWAFTELNSDRFIGLYNGYGPTRPLIDKSRNGDAFDTLDTVELCNLTFMHERVRGRHMIEYLTAEYYDYALLEKSDFNNIYMLPELAREWPLSFNQWAMRPASLEAYDIKNIVNHTMPRSVEISNMAPATIGIYDDKLLLVDGYFRALIFLRDGLPHERFNVYIPTL